MTTATVVTDNFARLANAETDPDLELNLVAKAPSNSVSVQHWLITGIPTDAPVQYKSPSSLFPQYYPDIEPERRILRYDELLKGTDKFTGLICYLMVQITVNGNQAATPVLVTLNNPEIEIRNRTLYLNCHELLSRSGDRSAMLGDNWIMLHPRQHVTTMYRVVERWYLTFHNRPHYIKKHISCPHTIVIDEDGNENSLFEFNVGEHKCFRDGNVQLTTSDWGYALDLDELVRVTSQLHVAFCGDEAIVLNDPIVENDFSIGIERTDRGKLKVHIHKKPAIVEPYPAAAPIREFKLPKHVRV